MLVSLYNVYEIRLFRKHLQNLMISTHTYFSNCYIRRFFSHSAHPSVKKQVWMTSRYSPRKLPRMSSTGPRNRENGGQGKRTNYCVQCGAPAITRHLTEDSPVKKEDSVSAQESIKSQAMPIKESQRDRITPCWGSMAPGK